MQRWGKLAGPGAGASYKNMGSNVCFCPMHFIEKVEEERQTVASIRTVHVAWPHINRAPGKEQG